MRSSAEPHIAARPPEDVQRALGMVRERYRLAGRSPEHVTRVGRMIAATEPQSWLICAGLLHDIRQDTGTHIDEIARSFDARVVLTVQALSVPAGSPVAFQHRKRELRARVTTADWGTALVFAADITDRLRDLHRNPAPLAPQRRAHYAESMALIHRRLPQLPWNAELHQLAHATLSDQRRHPGP